MATVPMVNAFPIHLRSEKRIDFDASAYAGGGQARRAPAVENRGDRAVFTKICLFSARRAIGGQDAAGADYSRPCRH
jgi:hypothetical protein